MGHPTCRPCYCQCYFIMGLSQRHQSTLNKEDLNPPMTCSNPGSHGCLTSCCCNPDAIQTIPSTKSGRYVVTTYSDSTTETQSCWNDMEKYLVLGFASIIVPSGYCNDSKSHHPRIKGGLFIILNYLVNMAIMGVTLGYTILHRVPNEFRGITITNPSIKVKVPSSDLKVDTGFVDITMNMPNQDLNLGSLPSIDASFNTESTDRWHAIIFPIVLAVVCLPFTIMRAAMMELDCFVTRKKQLGEDFDEFLIIESSRHKPNVNNRRQEMWSLRDILAKNVESKELKCRLYSALCCSCLGIIVMTVFMMLMGVLLYLNL